MRQTDVDVARAEIAQLKGTVQEYAAALMRASQQADPSGRPAAVLNRWLEEARNRLLVVEVRLARVRRRGVQRRRLTQPPLPDGPDSHESRARARDGGGGGAEPHDCRAAGA